MAMVSAGSLSRAQWCFCRHLLTIPVTMEPGACYKRGHIGRNDSRPQMCAHVRRMGEQITVLQCSVSGGYFEKKHHPQISTQLTRVFLTHRHLKLLSLGLNPLNLPLNLPASGRSAQGFQRKAKSQTLVTNSSNPLTSLISVQISI